MESRLSWNRVKFEILLTTGLIQRGKNMNYTTLSLDLPNCIFHYLIINVHNQIIEQGNISC